MTFSEQNPRQPSSCPSSLGAKEPAKAARTNGTRLGAPTSTPRSGAGAPVAPFFPHGAVSHTVQYASRFARSGPRCRGVVFHHVKPQRLHGTDREHDERRGRTGRRLDLRLTGPDLRLAFKGFRGDLRYGAWSSTMRIGTC